MREAASIKISIITPVYNGEKFISQCLRSVIDQKCQEAEHIIIDGGSADRTVPIIQKFAEKYHHIRWVSEKDKGQSDAMNKGLSMAKGKIISFLNVDDFYEPHVFHDILKLFETLPEPSLVVGNCRIWGDQGELLGVNKPRKLRFQDLLLGPSINPVPNNPSAYFYHKALHQKTGLYDISDHYSMDIDFLFKAVQYAHVLYIDKTLGNYQKLEGTKTVRDYKRGTGHSRVEKIIEKHLSRSPLFFRLYIRFLRTFLRKFLHG